MRTRSSSRSQPTFSPDRPDWVGLPDEMWREILANRGPIGPADEELASSRALGRMRATSRRFGDLAGEYALDAARRVSVAGLAESAAVLPSVRLGTRVYPNDRIRANMAHILADPSDRVSIEDTYNLTLAPGARRTFSRFRRAFEPVRNSPAAAWDSSDRRRAAAASIGTLWFQRVQSALNTATGLEELVEEFLRNPTAHNAQVCAEAALEDRDALPVRGAPGIVNSQYNWPWIQEKKEKLEVFAEALLRFAAEFT